MGCLELMAAYARSGAARADIVALDVVRLGESSVFATVNWHVRDAGGGLLKDFHTTYHLLRVDGDGRILSYTNHDSQRRSRSIAQNLDSLERELDAQVDPHRAVERRSSQPGTPARVGCRRHRR